MRGDSCAFPAFQARPISASAPARDRTSSVTVLMIPPLNTFIEIRKYLIYRDELVTAFRRSKVKVIAFARFVVQALILIDAWQDTAMAPTKP
jgi:hypothetical protein